MIKNLSIDKVKKLGLNKSDKNLDVLIQAYFDLDDNIDLKREIVSSIGRQIDNTKIYSFIKENVYNCGYMDLVCRLGFNPTETIKELENVA